MKALLQIAVYLSEDDEGGKFTAHCLNMDVLADDDTIGGAVSKLLETIEATLEAAIKHDAQPFRAAPDEYWAKPDSAKVLPEALFSALLLRSRKA